MLLASAAGVDATAWRDRLNDLPSPAPGDVRTRAKRHLTGWSRALAALDLAAGPALAESAVTVTSWREACGRTWRFAASIGNGARVAHASDDARTASIFIGATRWEVAGWLSGLKGRGESMVSVPAAFASALELDPHASSLAATLPPFGQRDATRPPLPAGDVALPRVEQWSETVPESITNDPRLLPVRRRFTERVTYSATYFERLKKCTARELFAALKLRAPESDLVGVRVLSMGILTHDVLERFYRERQAAGTLPLSWAENDGPNPLVPLFDELGAELMRRLGAAADRTFRARIAEAAARSWEVILKHDTGGESPKPSFRQPSPFLFEWSFGAREESHAPPISVGSFKITGAIDRVDRIPPKQSKKKTDAPSGPWGLAIIDYKTGVLPQPAQMREDKRFQLVVYRLAMKSALEQGLIGSDASISAGTSYYLQAWNGKTSATGTKEAEWAELELELENHFAGALAKMRDGAVPFAEDASECGRCDYAAGCPGYRRPPSW
jgi:RecB family exonuclease